MKPWVSLMKLLAVWVGLTGATVQGETLVAVNAFWKYLDDGSDQGTAWRAPNFNDSVWAGGPAVLGFGLGGEATKVRYGSSPTNVNITTYFRHAFTVANPEAFNILWVRLMRDDGVIVYLNGTEVLRNNMTKGDIKYDDPAAIRVGDTDAKRFHSYRIGATPLVAGTNVVAVEIHQVSHTSDDLRFALELIGATALVSEGDTWRYFKGTSYPTGWTDNSYDDANWLSGPSGFGYGDTDDATVLDDMQNAYTSVFTRIKFVVPTAAVLRNVKLIADYDDGFVAYINGTEIARGSMPAGPVNHTTLGFEHEASGSVPEVESPMPKEFFSVNPELLLAGTNVLAVSGHNQAVGSSDFSLIIELIADVISSDAHAALTYRTKGVPHEDNEK